jgi:PAS domain S-box-containing protein
LINSEERFKNIYINSPIAIELYNVQGRLIDVNPACCALFGIKSSEEVRGFLLFDDPNIPADQRELLLKGLPIQYETEFDFDLVKKLNLYQTSRSGKISIDVLVTPIRKGEQQVFDYLVQIMDITERKRAEELLVAEQARIKAITMTAQDAILMMDPNGNIQFFNPSAEKILGYSREEVIGRNLHALLAPQHYHPSHNHAYKTFLKTGEGNAIGKNIELEAKCKDGRIIDIELSLSALEFPDGWYAIGIMRDITEKNATGRKVKLLAHSLESISECVTITNSNDLIIYVNDSLLKTYGYSENELIGQHINILRPDVLKNKRARDIFAEIPGRGWRGEIMNVRKNGQIFPVLLSTSCIKDENDTEIAMIGVAIDITEIRKNREELIAAKEKAEESNRLKTAFLATMNHELRTPLNHIIGFSDLILSGSNPEESLNYATFISHSGKNLLSIIEDVFDLALVENANIKLRNQTFSLVDHFMENKASFDEIMKNSSKYDHIRLVYKPDTNCLQEYVTADRSKINQVLTNLFKNAMKFTQHGTIEFGYRFDNKSNLSYYVTDTGIGIPQDKQDIIFDFFRQVDDSVTRNYGGIGIGLAISLKIARILKGELTVVSELGKGSTFTLTIPVVVSDI